MIRRISIIFFISILLIFDTAAYSIDVSKNIIEKYNLKISKKFANTYCNSIKFGISKDSSLEYAIGETNKEFLKNKLNKYIDYDLLNKNILLSLENNCYVFELSSDELVNLKFE